MKELDMIGLADGRRGTIVYVHPSAQMIIVEAGPELIDYEVHENGLKEISRITVGPEDHTNCLIESKKAADRGDNGRDELDPKRWPNDFSRTTGVSRNSSRSPLQRVLRPLSNSWTAPRRKTTRLTGLR